MNDSDETRRHILETLRQLDEQLDGWLRQMKEASQRHVWHRPDTYAITHYPNGGFVLREVYVRRPGDGAWLMASAGIDEGTEGF
jgi:hypothetical protein